VHGLLRIYRNHFGMLDYSDCDDLTGLLNRRTFDETFRRVAARIAADADADAAKRSHATERPPHLAVIDIDFFKRVNDRFGHPYGDEMLVLLARLMSNHFGEAQLLLRFGGEEFVFILTELTKDEAHETLEKFRRSVETFAFPQVGPVTISIGSTAVKAGDTGSGAFGRADQALYHSKRNGRNQTHSYEDLIAAGLLSTSRKAENDVELFDALAPTKS
jgi:diguanylate cyclase (GGDEF)-like protein